MSKYSKQNAEVIKSDRQKQYSFGQCMLIGMLQILIVSNIEILAFSVDTRKFTLLNIQITDLAHRPKTNNSNFILLAELTLMP